jgi:hypothetical protein
LYLCVCVAISAFKTCDMFPGNILTKIMLLRQWWATSVNLGPLKQDWFCEMPQRDFWDINLLNWAHQ